MNKKYMDFVPATAKKKVKGQPVKARVSAETKPVAQPSKSVVRLDKPVMGANKHSLNELDKTKETVKLPKPTFVNTEKVRKRPLSKNVYQKKIEMPPIEESSAPVTIINKPEKDSKVGLIVTIIITIILGAAAGTVAFLLLPK